jgi:hypothetical protein
VAEIVGFDPANTGQTPVDLLGNPVPVGVWGDSTTGVGVFGTSGALTPNLTNIQITYTNAGVIGHSIGDAGGAGVWGESIQGTGVVGRSQSNNGVLGVTSALPPSAAVVGSSLSGAPGVVGFVGGDAAGVIGNSMNGPGVQGVSGSGNGVVGQSVGTDGAGVFGTSDAGVGVGGTSPSGYGMYGYSAMSIGVAGTSGSGSGVVGTSTSGYGVVGTSSGIGYAAGVLGQSGSDSCFAGFFIGGAGVGIDGDLLVGGYIYKGGGGFMIDHPLDPANKYLRHSFVESPDMLNVYNGNITTDANGEATVTLPNYFSVLNQDFRYQLTVIGQFAQAIVSQEISNDQFTIKTDQPRVKVSWQVTGIRRDPWAVANRIAVEEEKAAKDKGRYLHPELWGRPKEEQVHHRLVAEAGRLAELVPPKEPLKIDHSRLEEEWRQMQDLVKRMNP